MGSKLSSFCTKVSSYCEAQNNLLIVADKQRKQERFNRQNAIDEERQNKPEKERLERENYEKLARKERIEINTAIEERGQAHEDAEVEFYEKREQLILYDLSRNTRPYNKRKYGFIEPHGQS